MSNDLGEVGGAGVRVGRAEEGEEADGLAAEGGGGFAGGGGVVLEKGGDEDGEAVGGEGFDEGLEVFDGEGVRVAVGEFGEGGEDAGFELYVCEVGGGFLVG